MLKHAGLARKSFVEEDVATSSEGWPVLTVDDYCSSLEDLASPQLPKPLRTVRDTLIIDICSCHAHIV